MNKVTNAINSMELHIQIYYILDSVTGYQCLFLLVEIKLPQER